jgi:dephospho-CoA kinase
VIDQARVLLGGGIGSGKSAAASVFALLGAVVLSADRAAHRALEPGGGAAAAVAARWPEAAPGGRIDRRALAELVFEDPEALAELESLTHPVIAEVLAGEAAAARSRVVVVEVPLPIDLLGPGWRWVVVDAPDDLRLTRLVERGMSRPEARQRMEVQPSRAEWLERADLVVDNRGSLAALEAECLEAWKVILQW